MKPELLRQKKYTPSDGNNAIYECKKLLLQSQISKLSQISLICEDNK